MSTLGHRRSPESRALLSRGRVSLGTALSTISLTTPAVLIIAFMTNRDIILGLGSLDMVVLTLAVSMLTFALERTNVLQGAIHLVLFLAYLVLMFEN